MNDQAIAILTWVIMGLIVGFQAIYNAGQTTRRDYNNYSAWYRRCFAGWLPRIRSRNWLSFRI